MDLLLFGNKANGRITGYTNHSNGIKGIDTSVTVCFKKQKPEIVTIYDFKSTSAIGGIMFLMGILSVVIDVVI